MRDFRSCERPEPAESTVGYSDAGIGGTIVAKVTGCRIRCDRLRIGDRSCHQESGFRLAPQT